MLKPINKSNVSNSPSAYSSFLPVVRQNSNTCYDTYDSRNLFTDDVSLRISKLNDTLNRITEKNYNNDAFRMSEMQPRLFFE